MSAGTTHPKRIIPCSWRNPFRGTWYLDYGDMEEFRMRVPLLVSDEDHYEKSIWYFYIYLKNWKGDPTVTTTIGQQICLLKEAREKIVNQ